MSSSFQLPSHIVPLDHQLAGHFPDKNKINVIEMLKDTKSGYILKAIVDSRGMREHIFYQTVRNTNSKLQQFVPQYFGLTQIGDVLFIRLADITEGLDAFSNMDVKVGAITYDPEADSEKIKKEINKYQWMSILGFRICGLRVELTYSCSHTKQWLGDLKQTH